MSGSRDAMVIGAALLVIGAAYVALRGNHATANEHDTDDALDEAEDADPATILGAALEAVPTQGAPG
jgi:hypothetical protein